jgi:hypothetical protein
MFLQKLFASIRARRRSTQQRTDEEGAQISRRLRELLDVTKPAQVEMPFTRAHSGSGPGYAHREKTGTSARPIISSVPVPLLPGGQKVKKGLPAATASE